MRRSITAWTVAGILISGAALAQKAPDAARTIPRKAIAAHERPFGHEGDPRKVSRTITVEISDAMRFFPGEVKVRRGQTVRFVVRNTGREPHQFVLGTHEGLKIAAERTRHVDGGQPLGLQVRPGQTGRLVWHFTRAGEFHYACLMPGHFEAGAIGTIIVR